MTISMYDASVPVFRHQLGALSNILGKGGAHAEARKLDPAVLLQARLFPDMFPLAKQVQIACDMAKGAVTRLAGLEAPVYEDSETNFGQLGERCDRTRELIDSVTPDQINGSEDREIVLKMRDSSVTFRGQQYLLGFAMPNFYFHMTAVYAILRHCGVELGKRDFLGA